MAKRPEEDPDEEDLALPDEEGEGDTGRDDDESGDASEAGQESQDAEAQEGEVVPPPEPSRATRRVQEAVRAAREASDKAAALEREIAALRAERQQQQQAPQETPEQEAARLALMTAEERIDYRLNKAEQRHTQEMRLMAFRTSDATDKASYEAKAAYDSRYKKYQKEVEEVLAQERARGSNPPREVVLKYVLGDKLMAANSQREKAAQAGKERIRQQQSRADSGRSDRPTQRTRAGQGNTLSELEKRLDGVYI